MYNGVLM